MSGARRKFWGWGLEGQGLSETEADALRARVAAQYGVAELGQVSVPRVEEIELRRPRLEAPGTLAAICTTDPYERLVHSYGKSFPDSVRPRQRIFRS